jgi:hypothetical protein
LSGESVREKPAALAAEGLLDRAFGWSQPCPVAQAGCFSRTLERLRRFLHFLGGFRGGFFHATIHCATLTCATSTLFS